jgi:hypothetical protein
MGHLKPVGSEKLQGMDKIRRIIEISNYNLNIPQPINEDSSNEYKKVLADGNTYHIVKEKNGYVIKRGLYESTADYIEPMKNRKFYPSYSQALKRLNLITKEVNSNEGQIRNISLFESDDTTFVLTNSELEEQGTPQLPAPQQQAAPAPQTPTPPPPTGEEEPEMDMPDMEEPEMDMPDMEEPEMDMPEDGGDEDEEKVTFKTIQKITGRLGQKIRDFLSDEENEMTSKDVKYVINSILSALDLDALDDEDKEEIMIKFEGGEEEGEDMPDMEEPEMDMPDMEEPEMDMPEDESNQPKTQPEVGETHHRGNMRERQRMQRMDNSISESKIDKVLGKYIHEQYKSKNSVSSKISKLSESYIQEVNSKKILSKFPNSLFLGKTKNGNMAFEINEEVIYISPKGNVL